jgi:release factor glutamine methyltransferase
VSLAPEEVPLDRSRLVAVLAANGCVAPGEEADELLVSHGGRASLAEAVARRLRGEPLAWVCGTAEVGGRRLEVREGVYVPRRWQTPSVAAAGAARLPATGVAVDLCTGSGAVAVLLQHARPRARVLAVDVDPVAVRCARSNGVDALVGDLFGPLPATLAGELDVVTAVAPYVPTRALPLLPREALDHEPLAALDGGPDGLATIRRITAAASSWLRPGGSLVLEHGPDQAAGVAAALGAAGMDGPVAVLDPDGEPCGTAASRAPR